MYYTVSQKTSHLWFDIILTYVNAFWYFFGRYVTNKVCNQKTFYCATPNNLCFCTTWQTGKHKKSPHFSLKCSISALPEFNQSVVDFFSLFDSRLILTLLYDSLNLVINAFSSGLLGAWFRRKEVESAAARTMHVHQCAALLKEKNVICDVW